MIQFAVSVNSLPSGEAEFYFVQSEQEEINMSTQKEEAGNPWVNKKKFLSRNL